MRTERDLKQIEVAQGAGIAESQLSEIERGVTNPGWLLLSRIINQGLDADIIEFAQHYKAR
jgi:transcriptional regulator with XRE-family HTH domain